MVKNGLSVKTTGLQIIFFALMVSVMLLVYTREDARGGGMDPTAHLEDYNAEEIDQINLEYEAALRRLEELKTSQDARAVAEVEAQAETVTVTDMETMAGFEEDMQVMEAELETAVERLEETTQPSLSEEMLEEVPEVVHVQLAPPPVQDTGKLSGDTVEFLSNIPADVLPTGKKVLKVRNPVDIDRLSANNPFPKEDTLGKDPTLRDSVGLVLEVKQRDMSSVELLKEAREAIYMGQVESAVAYYKQVLGKEPSNIHALFGLATAYHINGQYEQAREAYIAVIKEDQNNWSAFNNFLILVSQEDPKEALLQLKELQKNNPQFAPIPAQIGMIYMEEKEYKQAANYLSKAAILDADNMQYRYTLAQLMEYLGDKDNAIRLYQQMLQRYNKKGIVLPESPVAIHKKIQTLMAQRISSR